MKRNWGIFLRMVGDFTVLGAIFVLISVAFIRLMQFEWPREVRPVGDLLTQGLDAFGAAWPAVVLGFAVIVGWLIRRWGVGVQKSVRQRMFLGRG